MTVSAPHDRGTGSPTSRIAPHRATPATQPAAAFPAAGGHVTVRVIGFHERAHAVDAWKPDILGRFEVVLAREPGRGVVVISPSGRALGHLPATWARITDRELWHVEVAATTAVARATLSGPKGERDLCVLLSWPTKRS